MCSRYEPEIFHSPSELPFFEHSTHPKKVYDFSFLGTTQYFASTEFTSVMKLIPSLI
jgi:hypothetical protein